MKTKLFFFAATLVLALTAAADDQLRNVQRELKNQGFYYGEVDGQSSPEMNMAVRRYQIRNGLEVTGTLTNETLSALGLASAHTKAAAQEPAVTAENPPNPSPKPAPPVNIRRDKSVEDSDRDFLRREETKSTNPNQPPPSDEPPPGAPYSSPPEPGDASVVPPPAPLDAPSADFPVLFAGTPYANAPLSVQRDTLRRAQSLLSVQGFYQDIVDGLPGPATEEGLLTFQRATRLPLTGRLDLDTLNKLRLLPGNPGARPANPGVQFGLEFRWPHHFFRGIWVGRD